MYVFLVFELIVDLMLFLVFCRKTLDSRRSVSSKLEDGYSWRKYGQKGILNSKYPRYHYILFSNSPKILIFEKINNL